MGQASDADHRQVRLTTRFQLPVLAPSNLLMVIWTTLPTRRQFLLHPSSHLSPEYLRPGVLSATLRRVEYKPTQDVLHPTFAPGVLLGNR